MKRRGNCREKMRTAEVSSRGHDTFKEPEL
jgi:hypothetical protein